MPRKSDVTNIMVHCLATRPSWMSNRPVEEIVKEVRSWHVNGNKWRDIAYAGIIGYDGEWGKGRDLDNDGDVWEEIGAGARGWNINCIHIALQGGRNEDGSWGKKSDLFTKHFTYEQYETLFEKVEEIYDWLGHEVPLIGHNQVNPGKGCPAFYVPSLLNGIGVPEKPVVPIISKQGTFITLEERVVNLETAVANLMREMK